MGKQHRDIGAFRQADEAPNLARRPHAGIVADRADELLAFFQGDPLALCDGSLEACDLGFRVGVGHGLEALPNGHHRALVPG